VLSQYRNVIDGQTDRHTELLYLACQHARVSTLTRDKKNQTS